MSPRLRKIVVLLVAVLVAIGLGAVAAGSAQAAGGGAYCPPSTNGAGPLTSPTLNVISGGFVVSDQLVSDDTAGIVCVQSMTDQGSAYDNYDGTVTYASNPGSSGTDQFTVGATDGDKYYSMVVTVKIKTVRLPNPKLVRKLVTKRVDGHAVVVRKAVVRFTNPAGNHLQERVMFGSFKNANPDGMRLIASGSSAKIVTRRASLDFILTVLDASGNETYIKAGSINTRTGRVTSADDGVIVPVQRSAIRPGHMWR